MNYFTSDWHLNESRIFEFNPFFRPFKSIEQQNDTIIKNLNRAVKTRDTLYHLGDVLMDNDAYSYLDRIKCKKRYLIAGNYDENKLKGLSAYFDEVVDEKTIELNKQKIYLNHYPSKAKKGIFSLVGHIHGLWKVQRNMINVSVDAWHFKPVSEKEILFTKEAIENYYDENVFPNS